MAPFPRTTLMAHEKHAGGRPSEYRPEYCEMVIEHMSKGYSLTSFAGSIRKNRNAVYEWMRTHAEFGDAVTIARSARVTELERQLLRVERGGEVAARIFALKNADPTEWRDQKYTQHQHVIDASQLSDAQLHAIAAGGSASDAGVIEGEFTRTATR